MASRQDSFLACPVCFEEFGDSGDHIPRWLPCTHTVCETCIKLMIQNEKVQCPGCRKIHDAKNEEKSFPQNRYLLEQILRNREAKESSTHKDLVNTELMNTAYEDACKYGTSENKRAKLNLVGHSKAGKSTFRERILGKPFMELESTEGISTHLIKSTFLSDEGQIWEDTSLDTNSILEEFNNSVLSNHANMRRKGDDENISRKTQEKLAEIDTVREKDKDSTIAIQGMNAKTKQQLTSFKKKEKKEIEYSLRLWDFGGQAEFLATHHLFLDAEATTVIMMDITKELREPLQQENDETTMTGIPNTPLQIFHYWLNAVYVKATEREKGKKPTIAVILTHTDLIDPSQHEYYIKNYIKELLESLRGKPYVSYLSEKDIFAVNNKNGNETDFNTIRTKLFQMFKNQDSWGNQRPVRWLKLEADIIDKAEEHSARYLDIGVISGLASSYGISDLELQAFLNFHHTLGDLIYYSDNALSDIVITDPQWLVDMFKSLITSEEFIAKRDLHPDTKNEIAKAIVTKKTLDILWKGNNVSFLIHLLTKFNLILPLDATDHEDERFLIPCILPSQQLDMYNTEPFKSMEILYNASYQGRFGGTLPVGTFHLLLAKCSKTLTWKICSDDHLSYTDASFMVGNDMRLGLTLLKGTSIRASVWSPRSSINPETGSLLLLIRSALASNLRDLNLDPGGSFLMLCPHWSPRDFNICLVQAMEMGGSDIIPGQINSSEQRCTFHRKELKEYDFPTAPSPKKMFGKYFILSTFSF